MNGFDIKNSKANFNIKSDGNVFSFGSSMIPNITAPKTVRRAQIVEPLEALKAVIKSKSYPMNADNAKAVPVSSINF